MTLSQIADPGDFAPIPRKEDGGFKYESSPPFSGSDIILRKSLSTLGVSKKQLSRILGVEGQVTVWKWFAGIQRPSALYLSRLIMVLIAHSEGSFDASQVYQIDWITGRVYYSREEAMKGIRREQQSENHISDAGQSLSPVSWSYQPNRRQYSG